MRVISVEVHIPGYSKCVEVELGISHSFSFRCFRYEYKCSFVPLRPTEADSLIVRQESLCLSDPQLKQLVTTAGEAFLRAVVENT